MGPSVSSTIAIVVVVVVIVIIVVTHADYVGRRGQDFRVSLFVCLSVCLSVCPQHNSKTNDFKVFKLGVGIE